MPDELFQSGGKIQNKYMGRFAQLKRSLREASGSLAQIQIMEAVTKIYPRSLRIIKGDKFLEDTLIAHGAKQSHIHDEATLAEMDKQEAQQQAEDRQLMMAAEAAKLMPPGKAIEPNSPVAMAAGA